MINKYFFHILPFLYFFLAQSFLRWSFWFCLQGQNDRSFFGPLGNIFFTLTAQKKTGCSAIASKVGTTACVSFFLKIHASLFWSEAQETSWRRNRKPVYFSSMKKKKIGSGKKKTCVLFFLCIGLFPLRGWGGQYRKKIYFFGSVCNQNNYATCTDPRMSLKPH